MSVPINAFYRGPTGSAMKFEEVGDFIDGTVLEAQMIPDQHNPGRDVLHLQILVDSAVTGGEAVEVSDDTDVVMAVYARPPGMQDAIGESGAESIDPDAEIRIEYTGDKTLPSGRTMKLYSCSYTASVLGAEESPF